MAQTIERAPQLPIADPPGLWNYHDRVGPALHALASGLVVYVEDSLAEIYGDDWIKLARDSLGRGSSNQSGPVSWDVASLLTVMSEHWNAVFRGKLSTLERSLIAEIRELRNRWAHQMPFDFDEAYRTFDSIERLLRAVGSPEAERIGREKRHLMRQEVRREEDLLVRRNEAVRRRRWTLAAYITCGSLLVIALLVEFGLEAWYLALGVVLMFGYFCYRHTTEKVHLYGGPHECQACHRIIYTEPCPYCASGAATNLGP